MDKNLDYVIVKKYLSYRELKLIDIEIVDQLNNIGISNWEREFFSDLKPDSFLVGCFDGDRLIGCEGYISYKLLKDGMEVLTHRSERTLVNQDFRGLGIFEGLIKYCDLNVIQWNSQFSWGATSAIKPFERAGFNSYVGFRNYSFVPIKQVWHKRLANFISLVKYVNVSSLKEIYEHRNLDRIKSLLAKLSSIKGMIFLASDEIKLSNLDLEKVANFQRDNFRNYYQLKYDSDLINWLSQHRDYRFLQVEYNTMLCGYLCLKVNENTNYISIVDISLINVSITKVMSKLSSLQEFKNFDAFFMALNTSNDVHKEFVEDLNNFNVLNKTRAGSFVIKSFSKKKVHISNLMLTDLWLEL